MKFTVVFLEVTNEHVVVKTVTSIKRGIGLGFPQSKIAIPIFITDGNPDGRIIAKLFVTFELNGGLSPKVSRWAALA